MNTFTFETYTWLCRSTFPFSLEITLFSLTNKQQAGNISDLEIPELGSLMQIYKIKLLQKAQALREANQRGLISSLEP